MQMKIVLVRITETQLPLLQKNFPFTQILKRQRKITLKCPSEDLNDKTDEPQLRSAVSLCSSGSVLGSNSNSLSLFPKATAKVQMTNDHCETFDKCLCVCVKCVW